MVKATTDGVVRPPSALVMIVGLPPSMAATAEFVVPRSMPTTCTDIAMSARCEQSYPCTRVAVAACGAAALHNSPALRACPPSRTGCSLHPWTLELTSCAHCGTPQGCHECHCEGLCWSALCQASAVSAVYELLIEYVCCFFERRKVGHGLGCTLLSSLHNTSGASRRLRSYHPGSSGCYQIIVAERIAH